MQAHNNGVLASSIELNNRWRKKEAAKGAELGLAMRQVYTQGPFSFGYYATVVAESLISEGGNGSSFRFPNIRLVF